MAEECRVQFKTLGQSSKVEKHERGGEKETPGGNMRGLVVEVAGLTRMDCTGTWQGEEDSSTGNAKSGARVPVTTDNRPLARDRGWREAIGSVRRIGLTGWI